MDRLGARACNVVHLLMYYNYYLPSYMQRTLDVGSRDESPPFLPGRTTNEQSTIGYYVYLPPPSVLPARLALCSQIVTHL